MKNLKPTKEDSFLFYEDIVNRINIDKRTKLIKIEKNIKKRFKEYRNTFDKSDICNLKEDKKISVENKKFLKTLYYAKNPKIDKLREELTTNEKGQVDDTCQFCTFGITSALDHFLPISIFQEYSINPLNLFPICSICNIKKSNNFKNEFGECLFLNLYTDILPEEQYLFVNLDTDEDGDFIPNFYLKNLDNKIDVSLFKKIENHYKELDLLKKFVEQSGKVLGELKNSEKETTLSKKQFVREAEERINSKFYNINNFKVVLEKEWLNKIK